MPKRRIRREISRPATPEEKARHAEIRRQVEAEKPQLIQKGLAILAAHKARQARLKTAVEALRVAREELGISLTELQRRTGINRSNLSRLENAPDPNPTIDTLNRYARAVGKEIIISLADRDEQGSPSEV